jgi:virulence-associated protein VagC
MSPITAKVFKAGNSKALRLPCTLTVVAKAYEITPTPDGFLIVDPAARTKRLRALNKLVSLPALRDDWPRP